VMVFPFLHLGSLSILQICSLAFLTYPRVLPAVSSAVPCLFCLCLFNPVPCGNLTLCLSLSHLKAVLCLCLPAWRGGLPGNASWECPVLCLRQLMAISVYSAWS
jgi:hypothetical protein